MNLTVGLFGFASGLPRNALAIANGLRITLSPALDLAAFAGTPYGGLNSAFTYLGGESAILGPNFPQQSFVGTFNLTYSAGPRSGIGGVVAFRTDAQSFDVIAYASGFPSQFAVYVDGRLLQGDAVSLPVDGSIRRVTIDYSNAGLGSGLHQIELVYNGSTAFGGIHVPAGSTVQPIDNPGPRLVVLGDSFTEGTGASDYTTGFAKLVGRFLDVPDTWASGEGGTGYETVLSIRPNLETRIGSDGLAASGDIYIVAMGLNDSVFSTTLEAAVRNTLAQLVAGAPQARIFVLGPWNPQAGLAYPKAQVDAVIQSVAAEFPGITFLDPATIPFTKIDATHPDQAGHDILAAWLAEQIRDAMGADGVIDQGTTGDIVGPLYVSGWSAQSTYAYAVYEGGALSSRFEVVETGSAFPILKLKPGIAIMDPGRIELEIRVQGSAGETAISRFGFDVRPHATGTGGADLLIGQGPASALDAGPGDDVLIGTAGADRLAGETGNDWLDGRGGADTLSGGPGDDFYLIDSHEDIAIETFAGGHDSIFTPLAQFALTDNFEDLYLQGDARDGGGNALDNFLKGNAQANRLNGFAGNDRLAGEEGDDQLIGEDGNDYLAGGSGADLLLGGAGDDAYLIEDLLDTIMEFPGQGIDTVFSAVASFTLTDSLERLTLVGAASEGFGNAMDNLIDGNAADNFLAGLGGDDGINGGAGNDTLFGGSGNDYLDGGAGIDRLHGEAGDDSYVVDDPADLASEASGEGFDTVFVRAASYTLPDNIERAIAVGAAAQAITGNSADNLLYGNAQDNTFDGAAGNDTIDGHGGNDQIAGSQGDDQLYGGEGDDSLSGGSGNDWLIGGTGSDQLAGGAGDDFYLVEDALDQIAEQPGEGTDWIYSAIAELTLPNNVERLKLYGGGALNGTGNALDNVLSGNDLANRLDGGDGNDYIESGGGDDTLIGGQGSDWLVGGTGFDRAVYDAPFAQFLLQFYADGSLAVRDTQSGAVDRVLDVEQLSFGADSYAIDWASHTVTPII